MSSSPKFPKLVIVTFTDGVSNDPVTVINSTTGENMTTNPDGKLIRVESKEKKVVIDVNNFVQGWTAGDVLTFSTGGTKAATLSVTLTSDGKVPQESSATAVAVSTAVLTI